MSGKPVDIESEGVWSLALDGHGDVLALVENSADPCGTIGSPCVLISWSTAQKAGSSPMWGPVSFGVPSIIVDKVDRFYGMVAVDQANGRVYVIDGAKETVWVFGPPVAPVVDRELTAEVGVSEAKLGALVNPGGIETSYRFEYGTREYEEGEAPHGQSTPVAGRKRR